VKLWQALSFSETGDLLELARCCEEAGFEGVLLSDHVFVPGRLASRYPYSADGAPPFTPATEHPEPWAAISAMAQITRRLRFSTSVYLPVLRHPLHVAKSLATASVLSGGRIALGVGVGWVREEFEVLGKDFAHRGARLDEELEILRKVWTGELVEHRGRFHEFPPLAMRPCPLAPIPIWVGGRSPAAMRRAVRHDGWLGAGDSPESAREALAELRALRAEAGLASRPFEAIVALPGDPEPALYGRLEDAGATGFVSYPPGYVLGPGASLDAARRAIDAWARKARASAGRR
jgi:probable F420-dependent oxidoreductase